MKRIYLPAAVLLLIANAVICARVFQGGVRLENMKPAIQYYLTLQMEADLYGDPATIKAFLPARDERQTIYTEKIESSGLSYSLDATAPNRRAIWRGEDVVGKQLAIYDAVVQVHPARYQLPAAAPIPRDYPPELQEFLEPTDSIQSDAPEIADLVRSSKETASETNITRTVDAIYRFVRDEVRASDYENTLDAATTLKWREAFCGGKSRLMTAMLRSAGIPARLVGGIILNSGSKRITHVWVEAWINGTWVPFDALNDHYAERPGNYLVLYRGDEVLFARTANINFQYAFNIKKWRTSPDEQMTGTVASLFNPYMFWDAFRKAHISLNLLRIILLLPVGVLVVVFFRNVVGMTTFGTFHPALIAVAFRETGLEWGVLLYVSVLVLGMLIRYGLDRIELLHTPRLSVLLVFVVFFMLMVTYVSVNGGMLEAAHVSLFPIAILTLTIESFFTTSLERGRWQALSVVAQTLIVVAVVYAIMSSFVVQAMVFVFPEILLGVIAASLVAGRWTGMRLVEYRRFRLLLVE